MAVFNAASEGYELCELDGKPVAFTNMRLDRQTIPDGLFCYDIRDSDNLDGSCAEVKAHVMVNHWGTILCKSPFPLDEYGSYYPTGEMNYLGISLSLQDLQAMDETELLEQQRKNTMTMGGM
ncbi:MAG: LPD28 domain-containing protein [Oscillospiraceae bacterium]